MLVSPTQRFPDSPLIIDSFASPELRGAEIRSDRFPSSYKPLYSGQPSPERIVQLLQEEEERDEQGPRPALILRHAIQWGVERGDAELVVWLAGLTGRWARVLDAEVAILEDEEGWGLVGMAVQASCGRQDAEEVVRVVVGRWGVGCGPRGGRDRTGWTPLHLSALISTPPLLSFLLTRGASASDTTNRGLTPLDLVAGIPDRMPISSLLEQASNQGTSALAPSRSTLTEGRQRLLQRRRKRVEKESLQTEERARKQRRDGERQKWVRERVQVIDVNPDTLFAEGDVDSDAESIEELVYSPANLPNIYDTIITNYQPVCQPISRRALPANMLYRYSRFALRQCGETWLEELLEGAVDRIEAGVYKNLEDLAYLAFWAYNTTLLLYLLVADDELRPTCDELGLLGMVEELINAIHVFVIRVAERRIDQVLDGAILDFETLEDFDDVRFEGEWALFRTLGRQRAAIIPKASQVFSDAVNAATETGSPSSLFNSLRGKSPFKQPYPPAPATPPLVTPSETPSHVTDILTGVLVVLHLYDVNPAITVQAFSQVFFWIAAELFNRILSRKKYLCRSKAIQIRMNITILDDWVRLHGLPAKTASQHFEPVLQLLQWLQTQSTINAFDDLIGTVQGLKRLNPLQMRRAVREYKFEVNEGRMDDECVAYLGQIQKDWETRRVRSSVEALKTGEKEVGTPGTPIDALFNGTTTLADFIPSSGPECFGELLDSRFMLPFQLPDNPSFLVATPTPDALYSNSASPFLSANASRTSFSTSRPFEFILPSSKQLKVLPDDFFPWLKAQEMGRRVSQVRKPSAGLPPTPAVRSSDEVAQLVAVPVVPPSPIVESCPLPQVAPPLPVAEAAPRPTPSLPSPHLRTSSSIDHLREQAQTPFRTVEPVSNFRPDSYELRIRQAVNSIQQEPAPTAGFLKHRPSMDILRKITSPTRQTVSLPRASHEMEMRPMTPTSPSSSTRPLPLMSPVSMTSSDSSDSKKKWWKIGRKEGSGESDRSEEGRRREASNGSSGRGALSPDGSRRKAFF